jgi:hypothetical protein
MKSLLSFVVLAAVSIAGAAPCEANGWGRYGRSYGRSYGGYGGYNNGWGGTGYGYRGYSRGYGSENYYRQSRGFGGYARSGYYGRGYYGGGYYNGWRGSGISVGW